MFIQTTYLHAYVLKLCGRIAKNEVGNANANSENKPHERPEATFMKKLFSSVVEHDNNLSKQVRLEWKRSCYFVSAVKCPEERDSIPAAQAAKITVIV